MIFIALDIALISVLISSNLDSFNNFPIFSNNFLNESLFSEDINNLFNSARFCWILDTSDLSNPILVKLSINPFKLN